MEPEDDVWTFCRDRVKEGVDRHQTGGEWVELSWEEIKALPEGSVDGMNLTVDAEHVTHFYVRSI